MNIFFLPELVAQIASYLSVHDITQCLAACRLLQEQFSPFLYRELKIRSHTRIHRDVWSLSRWSASQYLEPDEFSDPQHSDARLQAAKQYARGMEMRWRQHMDQLRTVVATCHAPPLLDLLVASLEKGDGDDGDSDGGENKREQDSQKSVRLVQLRRLVLNYGHFVPETRDLRHNQPPRLFRVQVLARLLNHSCCRHFLTRLWLPCSLLYLPGMEENSWDHDGLSSSSSSTDEDEEARDREIRQLQRRQQKRLAARQERRLYMQEFFQIVLTGGLEQLHTFGLQKAADIKNSRCRVDTELALCLVDGLLKVKTLERIECVIEQVMTIRPEMLQGKFLPSTNPLPARLKYLNLGHMGSPLNHFLVPILQNYGSALERLVCSCSILECRRLDLGAVVLDRCPRLRRLVLDRSPDAHFMMSDTSALSTLLKALRAPKKERRSPQSCEDDFGSQRWSMLVGESEDSDSDLHLIDLHIDSDETETDRGGGGGGDDDISSGNGPKGPGLVSFRIQKIKDKLCNLPDLLDGHWETLEELVIDRLKIPSPKAQLEDFLVSKSTSRLSTFSVGCGPLGYLWMESLAFTFPRWSCFAGLRVLRLTVGRAPLDGDSQIRKMVDMFYVRIGQCHQLEELEIGYSSEKGLYLTRSKYRAVIKDMDLFQFWDLTLPSPSLPSPQAPLLQSAILSRVSELWSQTSSTRPSEDQTAPNTKTDAEGGSERVFGRSLHQLAGLSKLRTLCFPRGDLWSRMGTREVEFMAEHWPLLQTIKIAVKDHKQLREYRELPHWQWLLRKRWDLDLTISQEQ